MKDILILAQFLEFSVILWVISQRVTPLFPESVRWLVDMIFFLYILLRFYPSLWRE